MRVRADAERQRTVILAEAYRDAERIRGAGDARAAEIYAAAYSQDRDFYAFYRSMQAYRESIGSDQDILVLQPDSEFFKFLQNQARLDRQLSRARSHTVTTEAWGFGLGGSSCGFGFLLDPGRACSRSLAPQQWRRSLAALARLDESRLRVFGLAAVIAGLVLLLQRARVVWVET